MCEWDYRVRTVEFKLDWYENNVGKSPKCKYNCRSVVYVVTTLLTRCFVFCVLPDVCGRQKKGSDPKERIAKLGQVMSRSRTDFGKLKYMCVCVCFRGGWWLKGKKNCLCMWANNANNEQSASSQCSKSEWRK